MTVPFLAASYVLFASHEAHSGIKLLQIMCGVNYHDYWFVNVIFDLISHAIATAVIYGVFQGMDFGGVFINYEQSRGESIS